MAENVYTVASGKGGVGKTTTVVNVGVALRAAGHSVALVDADVGMPNLGAVLGVEYHPTIHDALAGDASVDDCLMDYADGFAVIVGDRSLPGLADADPAQLEEIVTEVARKYEYVLVDTGGGLSHEAVAALEPVDEIVLVSTPDAAAVGDTRKTAEVAELVETPVSGVVVNRVDGSSDPEEVAQTLGVELLGAVPADEAVTTATSAGKPIQVESPDAPAAAAYSRLASVLGGNSDKVELDEEPDPADPSEAAVASEQPDEPQTDGSGEPVDEGDTVTRTPDETVSTDEETDHSTTQRASERIRGWLNRQFE